MTPETYIVRVYRRSATHPTQIVGRIELADATLNATFADLTELAAILEAPKKHLHQSEPGQSGDAAAD